MAATQYTADDLIKLPENGARYELVEGQLRTMTPTGGPYGATIINLVLALGPFIEERGLGRLFSESTGFLLKRNPDTVRCPDIGFVRAARLPPDGIPPGFIPFAPDLAVEVVSPSDTIYEVDEKVTEYLRAGACAVWVANPSSRTVTVHEPVGAARILLEQDALDGGDVLPGFQYLIRKMFAGVRAG